MNTGLSTDGRRSRSILASGTLFLLAYLSTPYLTTLSPTGILDAVAGALVTLAIAHALLALPHPAGLAGSALVVLIMVGYNLASRLYFEQQQTFLSAQSFYLTGEVPSLLSAMPAWRVATIAGICIVAYAALVWLVDAARSPRRSTRMRVATLLVVIAGSAEVGYARLIDESSTSRDDVVPIGYIARSTGLVPFVNRDIEGVAKRERDVFVRLLLDDDERPMSRQYSFSAMAGLLGRENEPRADAPSLRYPLLRSAFATAGKQASDTTDRTNVLLLVLESVRASEMGAYGARETATPFLDSLASRNVMAERFYANANFTVKSEHAIHCSTLDYLQGAPVAKRDMPVRTRCLPARLRDEGYRTLWFHGNTKNFYSRGDYLPKIGFEEILSRDELDPGSEVPSLGWGLADTWVMNAALNRLEKSNEPFYAEIMTLSNHLPFDYDWGIEFPAHLEANSTLYERYRRGIYYTDQAVKRFYERFVDSPLADNTLLVITGDHGIWTFPSEGLGELQKNEMFFRVPLFIRTPDGRRQRIVENASHLDIAPTIADLLGLGGQDDSMGRSLFEPVPATDDRVVYMMTEQALSYRFPERACVPSVQCQNNVNCYRTYDEEAPEALCYRTDRFQDLLLRPTAPLLDSDSLRAAHDRTLFDYSQMALELGTSPPVDQ